ncbi:MAG: hypothetical protein IJT30_07705 [Muribaculaceae bacterium]|nr:hypothetical protein [Muribaculaceae bacterium]
MRVPLLRVTARWRVEPRSARDPTGARKVPLLQVTARCRVAGGKLRSGARRAGGWIARQ